MNNASITIAGSHQQHPDRFGRLAVWAGAGLVRWGRAEAVHHDHVEAVRRVKGFTAFQLHRRTAPELQHREEAVCRTWFYGR